MVVIMKVRGTYINWSVFWHTYADSPLPLPITWKPVINNFEAITYAYGIFGERPRKHAPGETPWILNNPQNYHAHKMFPGWAFPGMKEKHIEDGSIFRQMSSILIDQTAFIAFGGESFNNPGSQTVTLFSSMMSSEETRHKFMKSAIDRFSENVNVDLWFTGIELDWMYPGDPSRGGNPKDFFNLEQFVKEFKQKNPHFQLSIVAAPFLPSGISIDQLPGYNEKLSMKSDQDYFHWLVRLCKAGLDDLQVTTFNYSTPQNQGGYTDINAPLYAPKSLENKKYSSSCSLSDPTPPSRSIQNTVEGLAKEFRQANLNISDYLWCSLGFFGNTYAGVKFSSNSTSEQIAQPGKKYKSPAPGGFISGNCGQDFCGMLTFREIQYLLSNHAPTLCKPNTSTTFCHPAVNWNKLEGSYFDKATGTAVAYDTKNNIWISYDNKQSIQAKISWLKSQHIKGVTLFSPNMDTTDFLLTKTVINAL